MARPVMKRRERVRVEFSLTPELAARVYDYADAQGLTLSQTGERLLGGALPDQTDTCFAQGTAADSPAPARFTGTRGPTPPSAAAVDWNGFPKSASRWSARSMRFQERSGR